jgi:hypothetical protein
LFLLDVLLVVAFLDLWYWKKSQRVTPLAVISFNLAKFINKCFKVGF